MLACEALGMTPHTAHLWRQLLYLEYLVSPEARSVERYVEFVRA